MSDLGKLTEIALALELHKARLEAIGGCSDGYCMVTGPKPRGTLVTNGGCRCPNDNHKMRRVLISAFELQQHVMGALKRDE